MKGQKKADLSLVITGSQDIFKQLDASGKKQMPHASFERLRMLYDAGEDLADSVISVLEKEQPKTAEILVIQRLSEVSDKDLLIALVQKIKYACETERNRCVQMYGCFLLPEKKEEETDAEAYANTYAALQRIEYHMMLEEALYQDIILITEESVETTAWLADAVLHACVQGGILQLHQNLCGDWRKKKEEYLSGEDILSGGLVKTSVLPEDSHSYCSLGYSCADIESEGEDSRLLQQIRYQLFAKGPGIRWIDPAVDEINHAILEEQRLSWADFDWDRHLLAPLRECSDAGTNEVELTRAQINARNTKAYVQGFQIEEKVQSGIQLLTERIQSIEKDILRNMKPVLETYGPGIMRPLEGFFHPFLNRGFEKLEEVTKTKVKRPVRQIVGSLSEEMLKERIREWKEQFQNAVESEIRAKIALHFVSSEDGGWDSLMVKPLERFADSCRAMMEELDPAASAHDSYEHKEAEEGDGSFRHHGIVNLVHCGSIAEWVEKQTSDQIPPIQIDVLKRNLIRHLFTQEKETTVLKIAADSIRKKSYTLADYMSSFAETHAKEELPGMIRLFVRDCFTQMLEKSRPVLSADTSQLYRRLWIVLPEKISEGPCGEILKEEIAGFLEERGEHEYVLTGSGNEGIVCYQSEMVLPLYELSGIWKWEKCFNQRMESETLDWKHYFPLALRHLNRNQINKKFYEEFFLPCVDYALKEKIIERKITPGEEEQYLYVMHLIPDSWTDLDVSAYNVGDKEGRAQKGEALFQYLHERNAFADDCRQQEIILPGSGIFSRPYDFSQVIDGLDTESISISYMKRILQKNLPLFVLLRRTVKRYRVIQKEVDDLRIKMAEPEVSRRMDPGQEKETVKPPVKKMRFCKFCGNPLKKGTEKFCPACGKQLR